jgi:D-alanine-D-alanine ligase
MSKKLNVAIVFGGKSPEHEVSIISARNIYHAINKEKFEVWLIGISQDGVWFLENEQHLQDKNCVIGRDKQNLSMQFGNPEKAFYNIENQLYLPKLDAAFLITHGPNGEDGSLQGIFMHLDIPFVGPGVLSSAVCMDKDFTKRILRDAGIGHAKGITLYKQDRNSIDYEQIKSELGETLFVKPCNMGSSVGVSKATNRAEFERAINEAFIFDRKILVEKGITGREIECAVLGNELPQASAVGEIIMNYGIYDFDNKYINSEAAQLHIPALNLTDEQTEKIRTTAIAAYKALGIEGMSRIDVFITDNDEVIINEPNTLPGFTAVSMYPKLWEKAGLPYPDLIEKLIDLAIKRHERDRQIKKDRL